MKRTKVKYQICVYMLCNNRQRDTIQHPLTLCLNRLSQSSKLTLLLLAISATRSAKDY